MKTKRYIYSLLIMCGMLVSLPAFSEITEKTALDFLYRYMPLPDKLDYPEDFYKANVQASLRAREEMPWGKKVPEREFLHFVLPVRVNNENLDMSRMSFYDELKPRVEHLSMKDAVLEINHWAHEKVTYRPSDARTSSPLASVSRSFGRCGEESTFGVAALRAMGIPARQIYTPRWAHTDDNHAWVEVWVDGKWYFLGACEPEPILDLAWFNAPAARGMLMNTDAFGSYEGEEEVIESSPYFTKINVTENYAPVGRAKVKVVDSEGQPVKGADVRFCLYNYAEFYPLAKKKTDGDGTAEFTSGLGDLLVWASDGERFGYGKISVAKDKDITVKLDKAPLYKGGMDINLVPPPPSGTLPKPTPEEIADNETRKMREDSIRNAYMATFFTPESGADFAREHGYNPGRVGAILRNAYGNHATITDFLNGDGSSDKEKALALLENLAEKDLSDISMEVILDHYSTPVSGGAMFEKYVLNPRIAYEMLTPYKSFFKNVFTREQIAEYAANPDKWRKWVTDSIKVSDGQNPRHLPISPASVYRHRENIDRHSRDIFFVAGTRSFGIPARIDEVTGKVQYSTDNTGWTDVTFENMMPVTDNPAGTLQLTYDKVKHIDDPKYYIHFTLSKIEDGFPRLMEYAEEATWSGIMKNPATMDEGQYMLVTGQRMADGTVLSHLEIFTVQKDGLTTIPLVLRQDTTGVQVIGNFNSENIYKPLEGTSRSLLSTTGRGYYGLALITPNSEPTSHLLNDISAYKEEFEKWGRPLILLFKSEEEAARFNASAFPQLPSTVVFGVDPDGVIAAEIGYNMKADPADTPIVIIADTFNRIVYHTAGYQINSGDRLLETIHKLR